MGFDAISNSAPASPAARDATRKKRGNRSAKLKQCKQDARREQWLSQVGDNKDSRALSQTVGSPFLMSASSEHHPFLSNQQFANRQGKKGRGAHVVAGHEMSDLDSPVRSPGSVDVPLSQQYRGNSMSLRSSSTWSSSRSTSEAEDDEGTRRHEKCDDSGVLDDWEVIADALSFDGRHYHHQQHHHQPKAAPVPVQPAPADSLGWGATRASSISQVRPRAWRPDDKFRPQSLPTVSKQPSFSTRTQEKVHNPPPSVAACPICYEDLDPTDSRFRPCPCGFRLCLFCHKRILEEDGRCPGCRKQYNTEPFPCGGVADLGTEEAHVLSLRFSRSCSMVPRY